MTATRTIARKEVQIISGGGISPFHLACNKYISAFQAFAPVKKKKWHKVKTMEDMDIPGARLY